MITAWSVLLPLADSVPDDDDVVAGGWGAAVFVALIIATALLCWSFVRQIRKAQAAKDAGVYGDEPVEDQAPVVSRPAAPDVDDPASRPTKGDDVSDA